MLTALRSRCLAQSKAFAAFQLQSRWNQTYEHTLQVRKDIEHQRERSKQGGGLKRIEAQHKKVVKS